MKKFIYAFSECTPQIWIQDLYFTHGHWRYLITWTASERDTGPMYKWTFGIDRDITNQLHFPVCRHHVSLSGRSVDGQHATVFIHTVQDKCQVKAFINTFGPAFYQREWCTNLFSACRCPIPLLQLTHLGSVDAYICVSRVGNYWFR